MVKRSDNDCLLELTSLEGAAGSSATTTAPGAPGTFVSCFKSSSLIFSTSDMIQLPELLAVDGLRRLDLSQSPQECSTKHWTLINRESERARAMFIKCEANSGCRLGELGTIPEDRRAPRAIRRWNTEFGLAIEGGRLGVGCGLILK